MYIYIYIYTHIWITTNQFSRFRKNEFDEMLCKLGSTEYARSFAENQTLPYEFHFYVQAASN